MILMPKQKPFSFTIKRIQQGSVKVENVAKGALESF
jgi:hypothetical protein